MNIMVVGLGLDFIRKEWRPYLEKCVNLGTVPMDCGFYVKIKYNL